MSLVLAFLIGAVVGHFWGDQIVAALVNLKNAVAARFAKK